MATETRLKERMNKHKKKICEKCTKGKHEQCITRDMTVKEDRCSCGCVGNPFVGISCVNVAKDEYSVENASPLGDGFNSIYRQ